MQLYITSAIALDGKKDYFQLFDNLASMIFIEIKCIFLLEVSKQALLLHRVLGMRLVREKQNRGV